MASDPAFEELLMQTTAELCDRLAMLCEQWSVQPLKYNLTEHEDLMHMEIEGWSADEPYSLDAKQKDKCDDAFAAWLNFNRPGLAKCLCCRNTYRCERVGAKASCPTCSSTAAGPS
jgi:hypothetical protein